jgi:hypothetical protein
LHHGWSLNWGIAATPVSFIFWVCKFPISLAFLISKTEWQIQHFMHDFNSAAVRKKNLATLFDRGFLEKLTARSMLKKSQKFRANRKIIIIFISTRKYTLSWSSLTYSMRLPSLFKIDFLYFYPI